SRFCMLRTIINTKPGCDLLFPSLSRYGRSEYLRSPRKFAHKSSKCFAPSSDIGSGSTLMTLSGEPKRVASELTAPLPNVTNSSCCFSWEAVCPRPSSSVDDQELPFVRQYIGNPSPYIRSNSNQKGAIGLSVAIKPCSVSVSSMTSNPNDSTIGRSSV